MSPDLLKISLPHYEFPNVSYRDLEKACSHESQCGNPATALRRRINKAIHQRESEQYS